MLCRRHQRGEIGYKLRKLNSSWEKVFISWIKLGVVQVQESLHKMSQHSWELIRCYFLGKKEGPLYTSVLIFVTKSGDIVHLCYYFHATGLHDPCTEWLLSIPKLYDELGEKNQLASNNGLHFSNYCHCNP